MKIKLSDCEVNPKKIEALENYCKKNNKLIALRDMKNRLLAVGLSVKALQTSKTKDGFNQYNVIYKTVPVTKTMEDNSVTEEKYAELVKNNFTETYPLYDVYLCVYDGMIKHKEEYNNKREEYWFKAYNWYLRYPDKFSIFDLINRSTKS